MNDTMLPQLNTARICKSVSTVKSEPDRCAEASSEVLFGEQVQVLQRDSQWCQIRLLRDGYEGFIQTDACDFTDISSTHWVSTRATAVFASPDIKTRVVRRLMFGSELTVNAGEFDVRDRDTMGKFHRLDSGGFVWAEHCLEKNEHSRLSLIELARSNYLHTPYIWGGRSTNGCDCSGLIQMITMATGVNLPRDSVDQEAFLTSDIEFQNRSAEDLVYWPGHVGILKSRDILLHSTAHSMRCCEEPLQDVLQRAGLPGSIKRIDRQ